MAQPGAYAEAALYKKTAIGVRCLRGCAGRRVVFGFKSSNVRRPVDAIVAPN